MLNFLYIDEVIIVLDKPAGLSVLPDGWEPGSPYLVKILESSHGKIWVVHRLDKITSGVMVFARTAEAHRHLNRQFEKHTIEKIYHAIVNGNPHWNTYTTRLPLRANVGHKHRTVVDKRLGKPAITHLRVLQRFTSHCLIEGSLETGRTHQVRVHAAALGYPILGDTLYGAPEAAIIHRPALHAHSIAFTHPVSDERLTFSVPYPSDLRSAISSFIADGAA
ncbi:MAG: RluA family pseudouridine synthase [Anaerolineales bacterium]|nr:RluA family pseudouridine synthase [Anaerolineales bacterium]